MKPVVFPKSIPYSTFGSAGKNIHFAHANAYPPETYAGFMACLSKRFSITAMHLRPMWKDIPMSSVKTWYDIAHDIDTFFEQEQLSVLHGIGHSLGAVCSLIAASENPRLFKSLFLIDPVLFPRYSIQLMSTTPISIRKKLVPIAKQAIKRRDEWYSEEDLFSSYRKKKVFSNFSDQAIRDFFHGGTFKTKEGRYRLRYSKAWEAHIYTTVVYAVHLLKQINIPITIIRAEKTDVISEKIWQEVRSIGAHITCIDFPDATHLVPFESPEKLTELFYEHLNRH